MLNYTVVPIQNPINKTKKYYAQLEPPMPINIDMLAKRISNACTVTPADVSAVLTALETQILYALQEGKSVRLGKIGSFHTTMRTQGVETAAAFTTANIVGLSVRFTPATELRKGLQPANPDMKFMHVQPRGAAPLPPASSDGHGLGA